MHEQAKIQEPAVMVPEHPLWTRLKDSEETLAIALSSADMATREWNLQTGSLSWAGSSAALYDLSPHETIPQTQAEWLLRIHPADRDHVASTMHVAITGGRPFEMEFRVPGKDGICRWIREKGQVICAEGRVARLVAVEIDVSTSRASADELQRAKLLAEAASQAKSQFLANMSHEIRTPIGAILGFVEMLAEPDEPQAARREYMRRIQRNGEQLLRLIDDILDLSKVESGRVEFESVAVSLADLLEDVHANMAKRASSKGLSLVLAFKGPVPDLVITDPVRLRQILTNVVGNAIKFSDRGEVSTTVHFTRSACADAGELAFVVRDSGPGIGPDGASRLFQPFLQIDGSSTRKHGGTGLGLALSRRLARCMGGDVVLTDTTAEGSEFTVTIGCGLTGEPSTTDSPDVGRAGSGASDRNGALPLSGLNVLVVDDSPDNRALIGRILELSGATVEYAQDGREGVAKGRDARFDVILMDMQMPEMDGYQATTELRRERISKPILAITAHALAEERDRCMRAGCTSYLNKPINRADLIMALRHMVQADATGQGANCRLVQCAPSR